MHLNHKLNTQFIVDDYKSKKKEKKKKNVNKY